MIPHVLSVRATFVLTAVATIAGVWLELPAIAAAAGFVLLIYFPGRATLVILGIEDEWSRGGRIALSLGLSLAIAPFFLNAVWHFTNDPYVLWAATALPVGALLLLYPPTDKPRYEHIFFESPFTRTMVGIGATYVFVVTIGTYWPTDLFGYPIASNLHDFVKHHAVLFSLERRPLPLGNVFYAQGADQPVHYYHFFYLIPATVRQWTHAYMSIELAFGISAAIVAWTLAGVSFAIVKRFAGGEAPATMTLTLITAVGALDILPAIVRMFEIGRAFVTLDTWAYHPYRIHNFLNQTIWSPQNVSGLIVVLVGVYLLSVRGLWRGWFVLGPILGASLLGSTVWVAMGALPALALWVLTRPKRIPAAVVVGLLILLLCWPSIAGYLSVAGKEGRGLTLDWPVNERALLGRFVGPGIVANLIDAPFKLTFEFGAKLLMLLLVPAVIWRRVWRDDGLRYLGIAAIGSALAFFIVRSELRHNDFGQKVILLAMAFTALMAGCAVDPVKGRATWWNPFGWRLVGPHNTRAVSITVAVVILLGMPMVIWEAPLTMTRRYLEEWYHVRTIPAAGLQDLHDETEVITLMRDELPVDAVVQGEFDYIRATLAQTIDRQIGVMAPQDDVDVFDPPITNAFGDRPYAQYLRCVDDVMRALREDTPADRVYATLRRYRITHLFIGWIERERWPRLARFDDPKYFTEVIRRGKSSVLALRGSADAIQTGGDEHASR